MKIMVHGGFIYVMKIDKSVPKQVNYIEKVSNISSWIVFFTTFITVDQFLYRQDMHIRRHYCPDDISWPNQFSTA